MRVFLLSLALLALPAAAQETPVPADTTDVMATDDLATDVMETDDLASQFDEAKRYDARLGLVTAVERGGVQRVAMGPGEPTLYASVRQGKVLDWIGVREDGLFMRLHPMETTGASGGTLHWVCGTGADEALHCWQIERPTPDDG